MSDLHTAQHVNDSSAVPISAAPNPATASRPIAALPKTGKTCVQRLMASALPFFAPVLFGALMFAGCGDDVADSTAGLACDAEPEILTTDDGVAFVRTPDTCFEDLVDFPYQPQYVELDGLRQAYFDEGPLDADPILLLHGQPSWSYLYRKMIPVLVENGHRVIAMDQLGMGRSDKPTDIADYSYLGHIDRIERFIEALDLQNITLFCQDWGSLTGLHVAGDRPERFARIVVGDGTLPVVPASVGNIQPPVENPNEVNDELTSPFASIPAQQPAFRDEEGALLPGAMVGNGFAEWMIYSMTASAFRPSEVVEALTYFPLSADEEAAYDAPFPSRIYMAGVRVFPSLINEIPGANQDAWAGLMAYEKPVLTIWATNDPGNLGDPETQQNLINNIPGATGQPHTRLPESSHFLQDDQGEDIAQRIVDFIAANPR